MARISFISAQKTPYSSRQTLYKSKNVDQTTYSNSYLIYIYECKLLAGVYTSIYGWNQTVKHNEKEFLCCILLWTVLGALRIILVRVFWIFQRHMQEELQETREHLKHRKHMKGELQKTSQESTIAHRKHMKVTTDKSREHH